MKRSWPFVVVLLLTSSSFAQEKTIDDRVPTEGFYFNLGLAKGPGFAVYFDSVNSYYGSRYDNTGDKIDPFGSNVNFSLGYLLRLYPNFMLDVGISIYKLRSDGEIVNNNPSYQEYSVIHDLEYQVGVFTATIPVLLDFAPQQPVVPYIGIGISVFSMRLDDIMEVWWSEIGDGHSIMTYRDSGTSVGSHFEAGAFFKLKKNIWIDFKGRWHSGSGHLTALDPPPPNNLSRFKMKQDISQYTLGVVYYFR